MRDSETDSKHKRQNSNSVVSAETLVYSTLNPSFSSFIYSRTWPALRLRQSAPACRYKKEWWDRQTACPDTLSCPAPYIFPSPSCPGHGFVLGFDSSSPFWSASLTLCVCCHLWITTYLERRRGTAVYRPPPRPSFLFVAFATVCGPFVSLSLVFSIFASPNISNSVPAALLPPRKNLPFHTPSRATFPTIPVFFSLNNRRKSPNFVKRTKSCTVCTLLARRRSVLVFASMFFRQGSQGSYSHLITSWILIRIEVLSSRLPRLPRLLLPPTQILMCVCHSLCSDRDVSLCSHYNMRHILCFSYRTSRLLAQSAPLISFQTFWRCAQKSTRALRRKNAFPALLSLAIRYTLGENGERRQRGEVNTPQLCRHYTSREA